MTASEKSKKLIDLLHTRTSERKLEWRTGDSAESVYIWFGDRRLELSEGSNSNGEPLEILTIINANGDLVEKITDESFGSDPVMEGFGNFWLLMSATRDRAYKQSIGAEDAIDDIINELGDDIPF